MRKRHDAAHRPFAPMKRTAPQHSAHRIVVPQVPLAVHREYHQRILSSTRSRSRHRRSRTDSTGLATRVQFTRRSDCKLWLGYTMSWSRSVRTTVAVLVNVLVLVMAGSCGKVAPPPPRPPPEV